MIVGFAQQKHSSRVDLEKQRFCSICGVLTVFLLKGPSPRPLMCSGTHLKSLFFSCGAQSVHIGNEQQCGCDISENANTIISTPPSQHQYLCAHGGGSEIPGPEFALS